MTWRTSGLHGWLWTLTNFKAVPWQTATYADVARRTGLAETTVRRAARGDEEPAQSTVERLQRVRDAYDAHVAAFWGGP